MAMSNKKAKVAQKIASNLNSHNQANIKNEDEKKRLANISKPTNKAFNNQYDRKYMFGQCKSGPHQVTNHAHGSLNTYRKNREQYPISRSEEQQLCVSGSGIKNRKKSQRRAQQKYGNSNANQTNTANGLNDKRSSSTSILRRPSNQTNAANGRKSSVSVNSINDKRSSSTIIHRKPSNQTSAANGRKSSASIKGFNDKHSFSTTIYRKKPSSGPSNAHSTNNLSLIDIQSQSSSWQSPTTEKFYKENTVEFPGEIVLQKSKLNPNTKPFVPQFKGIPNTFEPMSQIPTNLMSTSDQNQQTMEPHLRPTTDAEPIFTHYPHTASSILPTELIAQNLPLHDNPQLILPQPTNLAEKFNQMTIGMSHMSDIAPQIKEAASGQPLLGLTQFNIPEYSSQPILTHQAYQQVQEVNVRMIRQESRVMLTSLSMSNSIFPTHDSQFNRVESVISQSLHITNNHQTSLHGLMDQHSTDDSVSSTTAWTTTNSWTFSDSSEF